MKRRLFTLAAAVSLVLCMATVGLWVRSYWRSDLFGYGHGGDPKRSWRLHSKAGELQFVSLFEGAGFRYTLRPGFFWNSSPRTTKSAGLWEVARISTWFHEGSSHRFLGFGFVTMNWDTGATVRGISVPHWSLALLFAILPAPRLRAVIRSRRRHHAGHCPTCGYDLRATPERCPECGNMPAAPKPA